MQLYYSPNSPYARKVRVVLLETGRDHEVELVAVSGNPLKPETIPLAQNPLGKIPVLERSDGPALYDSRVICRFLDDGAGARLYPAGPMQWATLTLEATGDGISDAAVAMAYEVRVRAEATRSPDWIEAQWQKVDRTLAVLEDRWLAHLHGPLDIGQIALACALGYVDLRHAARHWREGRPGLASWYATFAERPSMRATATVG